MMRVARPLLVITGAAVAVTALSAQEGRQRPGGGPGGATRLIVRAVANGQPVSDLKPEDLTVRIDGKPREVKSLELVNAGAASAAPSTAASAPVGPKLPAPFDTNVSTSSPEPASQPGGRDFLFLLDEEGIGAGQEDPIRKAVAKIMSEAAEGDRFGYMSLKVGGRQVPSTGNRATVTEEMSRFVGGGITTESVVDITCRTKRVMGTLLNVMQQAPAGRTLVLVTSGLVANPVGIQPIRSRTNPTTGDIDNTPPETCQIRSTDLENFGTAAALSASNMYIVHFPQALSAPAHAQSAQTGIENLAGVSNAEFIRLTGGNEAALSRIARETASYYIATLDEAAGGGMRRIDAGVKRDGVKVIARPAAGRGPRPMMAESSKGKSPGDMVKTATTFTDVPLRAASFISKQGANEMKVVTLFEPVTPGTKLTAASVAVINEQDPTKASQLNLKAEDLQKTPITASLLIKPGRYRVRVAATTADGGGTVDSTVTAELPAAGSMRVSSMLVGVSGERGFSPRLQFTPEDKMVVGVLEVYGVPSGGNLTTQFEIAESESAQPMGAAPGNTQKGPTEDARMVFGGFGTESLQPGDYLMRIRISLDGKEVGVASRTFRKTSGS